MADVWADYSATVQFNSSDNHDVLDSVFTKDLVTPVSLIIRTKFGSLTITNRHATSITLTQPPRSPRFKDWPVQIPGLLGSWAPVRL